MGAATYTETLLFVVKCCPTCGVTYGLLQDFDERRRGDGKTFYCPNGHNLHYAETEEQKLKKQLETERARVAQARESAEHYRQQRDQAEKSAVALRGHLTRSKRELDRVKNGVCPCCNRSFVNLAQHMSKQHPEYQPADAEGAVS